MTNDIPLRSQFFTNRDGNTLMKEFEGILTNNPLRSRGQVSSDYRNYSPNWGANYSTGC